MGFKNHFETILFAAKNVKLIIKAIIPARDKDIHYVR